MTLALATIALLGLAPALARPTSAPPEPIAPAAPAIVDVQSLGAKCDGVTDDAPAIRAAIAAAGAGGTVFIPRCSKPYSLSSYDGRVTFVAVMFYPLEGQTIRSAEAQLKLADAVLNTPLSPNGGVVFMLVDRSHVTIEGVRLDMNGSKNLVPAGANRPGYAIVQEGGSYSSFISNEILDSPGRNAIKIGGAVRGHPADHCTLRGNTIRNGGTTIVGNVHQDDWSSLFVECSNATVADNQILMDRFPSVASPNNGGIELHASFIHASGNRMDKVYPGFYVGSDVAGRDVTDITIESNTITNAQEGISFFPISLTDNYGRIRISANTVDLEQAPGARAHPRGISMSRNALAVFTTGPGLLYDSDIVDNRISSRTATTDASEGIVLSQTRGVRILHNLLNGLGSSCVTLQGAPLGHTDTAVGGGNVCNDFGSTPRKALQAAFVVDAVNDTPPAWAKSTAYQAHQWVRPGEDNGYTYETTTGGTSAASEPRWPEQPSARVQDGSVVWTCRPPWPFSGLSVRDNFVSTSEGRPEYLVVYATKGPAVKAPLQVSDLVVGRNLVRNVGRLIGGSSPPPIALEAVPPR